jgi:hypothetical protein
MNPLFITAILDIIGKIGERIFPDPAQKAAAQLEVLKLAQAGDFKTLEADLQLALAQADINKVEAASPDFFRSGWRPFVGWICGLGLAYQFLFLPIASGLAPALLPGAAVHFPPLEMQTLLTLLGGMLGLGGFRTAEKLKGVA